MLSRPLRLLTAITGLALTACANSTPSAKEPTTTSVTTSPSRSIPVKEWPLKFRSHSFGAFCYDTQTCTIQYANQEHGSKNPSPPSAAYGPDYLAHLGGGHLMIRNFPPPAKVSWRSKDGQAHTAEIDIGELFADEIIRHNVRREEMANLPDGEFKDEPYILLEVNDRTIRVYMRAMIFLKNRVLAAGQLRGEFRNDLILVKTYTYTTAT
jgi:hypothetical protein